MMFEFPKFTPVTMAGVTGPVAPALMTTLEETVAIDGVPLTRFTVTSEAAGAGRLTAIGTDWFGISVTPDCKMSDGMGLTVTLTLASWM